MPIYEIELYELHTQMYRVKAANEAQAIKKLFDGGAHAVDDGLEYIEVCDTIGLPVDEFPDLAAKLRSLGVAVGDVISGIRSIEQVE